jgi:hypothetical protein
VAGLNRDVVTGENTAHGLVKGWSGSQALDGVDAQMQITGTAMPRLAKAIGDYAETKAKELNGQGNAEEAAKWNEGGIYRVAAHTALGALGGGLNGAVGSAAAASAAPTLDNLERAVKSNLEHAGLDNDAATVAAKLVVGGAAGTIGGALAGGIGAVMGLNVDANNRQLHPDEKVRIKELAAGDPQRELRLTAAACALVRCYAEYPENSAAYKDLKQFADYGASAATASERTQLSAQAGMFGYSISGMFSDTKIDAAKNLNSTYQIATRAVGAGKMALGVAGVVGSFVTAPVSCLTGVGCFANAAVATVSLDTGISGWRQISSGSPTETFLNEGLQSLGMSPQAAGWLEAGIGIGSAKAVGSLLNRSYDQSIAFNKAANASYRNVIVGDEPYSRLDLDAIIKANVNANIASTNKGNASSVFSEFARREALAIEALAAKQSPWPLGYTSKDRPMAVGEQFNMVVNADQAKGLSGPGGWATFSNIPNQKFARETLAITEEFKKDVSFVQQFEVIEPFIAKTGPIGPQIDQVTGRLLEGSKTTWQLELKLPYDKRILFIKPVGAPVAIK